MQISLFARGRSDGRMPKPPFVFRYRVRNWRAYNHALINRGRLTVWFDEHTVTAWRNTEPAAGPGAPRLYADLAIECALVFKSPTAHERAMKLCSSVGPRPPSCRGVRRNRTPPRILSVGGLRAITSSCRSRNRDAPRGGSSVEAHAKTLPRIRCSDSRGCSEGNSGRRTSLHNAPKRW